MSTPVPLPESTILVVEVGSTALGTGIGGGEDLDEVGVWIESPEQVFGPGEPGSSSMHRSQPDGVRSGPGDVDLTLHPLRKFLRLAFQGNPSILMCLWAPVPLGMHETPLGVDLRHLGRHLVGRHVIPRYRRYMHAQASRLLGIGGGKHGRRGGGQRPELIAEHGYDTKYAMHCSRLGFQCIELLETGGLCLPMAEPTRTWLQDVRAGKILFDEWWETTLDLDEQCQRLESDASIAPTPNAKAIEDYCSTAHLHSWGFID